MNIKNLDYDLLDAILEFLPVDISFIDADDTVQYFNKFGERIFHRPKSVIGRNVQDCHPEHSLTRVEELLDEMKAGERDQAEFWIDYEEMKVYIQYFAVRDENGEYIGCLEASQDISRHREITGEKRLLEEE
jgi:hypothetical protein